MADLRKDAHIAALKHDLEFAAQYVHWAAEVLRAGTYKAGGSHPGDRALSYLEAIELRTPPASAPRRVAALPKPESSSVGGSVT